MKLNEIGEFGFINRFKSHFDHLVQERVMGIGDDCSILPADEVSDWLVTTDMLMEGVHFLRDAISPLELGAKSLAVNLSDIAAMGGTPIGSFLSIAIPANVDVEYLDEVMKGYHSLSETYATPLLGGDTTRSLQHLAINVCVVGKCPRGKAKLRSSAKVGDLVCVSGNLGDSAAGLQVILGQHPLNHEMRYLVDRHHQPIPQIGVGLLLGATPEVHAMMDISDGIASDLLHILKASGCSATVDLDRIPRSSELRTVALQQGWDTYALAVGGGEDYELLLTVDPSHFMAINTMLCNNGISPLTNIGTIREGTPSIEWYLNGELANFSKGGFNHFMQ